MTNYQQKQRIRARQVLSKAEDSVGRKNCKEMSKESVLLKHRLLVSDITI